MSGVSEQERGVVLSGCALYAVAAMADPEVDTPPSRLLLGPGPSMVHPRVSAAMAQPLVGHLDPFFLAMLDRVQSQLRELFATDNELTLPISGTGSAGMETCFANLIEEGDEVVVGVNGVFGTRMAEVARRLGAEVRAVQAPWGEPLRAADIGAALAACRRPRMVALVHAETSTGVWQPVEEIAELAHRYDALIVLDTVTSLAGCTVEIDEWGVDAAYSATQKCLSCPPGLAPVTLGERAVEKLRTRKTSTRSWYFDLSLIGAYFGGERVYHHTAPIAMIYALAEALNLIFDEGLTSRFLRHEMNHRALLAGLSVLGLQPAAAEGYRLWMLNSVSVPANVDEAAVRSSLLQGPGIEIGPGLGPLAGKVWRIGLMGESSSCDSVRRLLSAMAQQLSGTDGLAALDAAEDIYAAFANPAH